MERNIHTQKYMTHMCHLLKKSNQVVFIKTKDGVNELPRCSIYIEHCSVLKRKEILLNAANYA